MHDNAKSYADALVPVRASVAGYSMLPFSIGHALLLQKKRSPLAEMWSKTNNGESINLGDAALAVWICKNTPSVALSTIGGFWMRLELRFIAKRILKHGISKSYGELINYIANGFSAPKMRMSDGGKFVASPMLGMLMVAMMSHFHRNYAEALNTPISFALWNRSILLDEKGMAELWSEDDYEIQQRAEELAKDPAALDRLFERKEEEQSNG